jgi:signal peptidase I
MSSALPIETGPGRTVSRKVAAAIVALGLVGFGFGYLGSWPPVATVMSGSMAPTIGTGDMVLFKRLAGPPRVGDVVAVTVPDEARARYGYPPQVIHRVVRIAPNGAITTKGDAKPTPDPFTVPASSVHTRVLFAVPAAGRIVAFLSSPMGLLWLAAGGVLLVGLPLFERRQATEESEQDALAAMRAELHTISEEITRIRTEPAVPSEPVTYVVRRRSGGLLGRLR